MASELIARLNDLDLSRVVFSAEISADGQLRPVGGMTAKLSTAGEAALRAGVLEAVVLAEGQALPEEYRSLEHLRFFEAKTLLDAVEKLHEQHGPRAAVRRREQERAAWLELPGRGAVPLMQMYQELPLLREVAASELPGGAERRGDEAIDASTGLLGRLRLTDIRQWEEAQTRIEETPCERHDWRTVFHDFRRTARRAGGNVPRLALLGPPGGGKSTFLRFLAHTAATGALRLSSGLPLLPASVHLRDWERMALRRGDYRLETFLAWSYRRTRTGRAPTMQQWQIWLRRGEVLLLLDGLDELSGDATFIAEGLRPLLSAEAYSLCPLVVTCRTVSQESLRRLGGEAVLPVFRLEGLERSLRNRFLAAYPARHPRRFQPDRLIEQLDRLPGMQSLACNPLLLALLCLVVDDSEGGSPPATRGQLYDRTIELLLEHYEERKRTQVRYPGETPDVEEKRELLQQAALILFAGADRSLTFSWNEFKRALSCALRLAGYDRDLRVWTQALANDLLYNSGLLRRDAQRRTFFLHLTIQEHLAACALADAGNRRDGWQQPLTHLDNLPTLERLVDRKSWDVRWREVLVLLAGRLENPRPFLQLLEEKERDDCFRHRLALAACALPEIAEATRRQHRPLIDRITGTVFDLCWQSVGSETGIMFEHLLRELPCLEQTGGRTQDGQSVLATLCLRVQSEHPEERSTALNLLVRLREQARPEHIAALRLQEGHVTASAVKALGILAAAAQPEHVAILLSLLTHSDTEVRSTALEALGRFAALDRLAELAGPVHAEAVLRLLDDPDENVQLAALAAAGRLRSLATPEHIAAVLRLLEQPSGFVHWMAAPTFGRLASSATAEQMSRLLSRLRHPEPHVAAAAAEALGASGAQARPEHITALLDLLEYGHSAVKWTAGRALGQLTSALNCDHHMQLRDLLQRPQRATRVAAAEVMEAILARTGRDPVAALFPLLSHPRTDVRSAALQTLEDVKSASGPTHLATLLPLLQDGDDVVRWAAASALGRLAFVGCADHITALLPLLDASETFAYVGEAALMALGELRAEATTEHLAFLLPLLRHERGHVRESAARAVGLLAPAARTEHVAAVLPLLGDPDGPVRFAAAQTLRRLAACVESEQVAALFALLKTADSPVDEMSARVMSSYLAAGWRGVSAAPVWQKVEDLSRLADR